MTHDLVRTILDRLDATLDRVVDDDLWHAVYYAKLYVRQGEGEEELEIDARPSDAIALAVCFEAPIFVAENILDTAMKTSVRRSRLGILTRIPCRAR